MVNLQELHDAVLNGQLEQAVGVTKAALADELRKCPGDVLVMGNLDPVGIFKQALAWEVSAAATALLNACGGYANFVISSGCDTPP